MSQSVEWGLEGAVFIYMYLLCLKVLTESFQVIWKCSQQGQFKAKAIRVAVWGPTLQGV